MSAFVDNVITDAGKNLIAEMQTGAMFVATNIVMGQGYVPDGTNINQLQNVIDPVVTLPVNKTKKLDNGTAIIGASFSNTEIDTPFFFRELGLYGKLKYANGDFSEEVLYSYGNAVVNAELIPAYATNQIVEKQLDLIIYIGNETEISVVVDTGKYVTQEQHKIDLSKKANLVNGKVPWEELPAIASSVPPQIIVTTKSDVVVTATSGTYTETATAVAGKAVLDLPDYGVWTVRAQVDSRQLTTSVVVDDVRQYFVNMTGAYATVRVTTSIGAAVTAENDDLTLTGTGSTTFDLFADGDWTITATLGDTTVTKDIVVVLGNTYDVDLRMLVGLEISSMPDKQTYLTQETFDPTGTSIIAKWKDGTISDITNHCTFEPMTMIYGLTSVTGTFSINNVTKQINIPVTVNKRVGTIALSTYSVSMSETVQTKTVTVTTNNTSDIIVETDNDAVATATISGKTITINVVNPGSCNISVYATADDDYTETPTKTIVVSVSKYTGTISLNKYTVSLHEGDMTDTITVTTNNTGAVVATSNNTNVATVSVSGKTITVTGKKPGTCVISVYAETDDVYEQTPTKTCTVNIAKFTGTISVNPTSVTLSPDNNLTAQVQVTTTNSAIYASTPSGWYTESVSGKTVTLIANKQGAGTASSLSIYGIADSVYNQTITKTVAVTVKCATLNVTAEAGATVFVEKGSTSYQQIAGSNGVASFKIWEYGVWSVYGVFNGITSDTVTINVTTTITYSRTLSFYKTYGVKIQKSNSNPETAVTYIDDAVGMTPKSTAWDDTPIFKGIRPCVVKDGVVQAYVNKNNMIQKEDGNTISQSDGDVMIEIPKIGYQITNDNDYVYVRVTENPNREGYCYLAHSKDTEGDCKYIYIGRYLGVIRNESLSSLTSVKPDIYTRLSSFRTYAANKGDGYEVFSFYPLTLLQCLYLIRYKNLNSQEALGDGRTIMSTSDKEPQYTGFRTATAGMYYGSSGTTPVVFAGIEDIYGNVMQLIDGVHIMADYMIKTDYNNYNDTGEGYKFSHDPNSVSDIQNYVLDIQGTNNGGFIIKSSGASSVTAYSDRGAIIANGILTFGGYYSGRGDSGMFNMEFTLSDYNDHTGARIMFKKKA